ncbi:alpha/beta hydrolase family protein [Nocardioides sp.]|uniref:alpha/beta hydrolase family protein n=1 Tax=Nocardioides sp. TaxID=35761 RepID=UPI003514C71F
MLRRLCAALVAAILLASLAACSTEPERSVGPAPSAGASSSAPTSGSSASTSGAASPTPSAAGVLGDPSEPVSLAALAQRRLDGGGLRIGREVLGSARHRQYEVSYRSGGLRVTGRLAVPNGAGPFPAVVLAHGYIEPSIYVNGQGMTRERAWLADRGFVVLHADYRGHADSAPDPSGGTDLRLGYTEDVLNAVLALRSWSGPVDDDRVALVGRSMGGGIVYNALITHPGLVRAGVVFAPVSSLAAENFDQFNRPDLDTVGVGAAIVRRHGAPEDNPRLWRGVSARPYFAAITEPVLIHHGKADDTCPPRWSRATARAMRAAGVEVALREYEGEGHAFGPQFDRSMQVTLRFLRSRL